MGPMKLSESRMIKFSHEEVEALLNMLNEVDHLNETEQSAREKLKKIYARQILSHERRQEELQERKRDEDNNVGLPNT